MLPTQAGRWGGGGRGVRGAVRCVQSCVWRHVVCAFLVSIKIEVKLKKEIGRPPGGRRHAAVSQTFAFERTTTYEVVVWFFQTLASVFWISSVFVYGGFEAGDILQLLAAIAWAMSNAAALPNTLKLRPSSARSRDVELDAV